MNQVYQWQEWYFLGVMAIGISCVVIGLACAAYAAWVDYRDWRDRFIPYSYKTDVCKVPDVGAEDRARRGL